MEPTWTVILSLVGIAEDVITRWRGCSPWVAWAARECPAKLRVAAGLAAVVAYFSDDPNPPVALAQVVRERDTAKREIVARYQLHRSGRVAHLA